MPDPNNHDTLTAARALMRAAFEEGCTDITVSLDRGGKLTASAKAPPADALERTMDEIRETRADAQDEALRSSGEHRHDDHFDVWTALIQTPDLNVTQLSVHLDNGQILHHNCAHQYETLFDGLLFGGDGSILMVVDTCDYPNGVVTSAEDISVPDWGTRLTYIPANRIGRVNLRTPTLPDHDSTAAHHNT